MLNSTMKRSLVGASRTFASSSRRASLADMEAMTQLKPWKGTNTNGGQTTNLIGGEWTVGSNVDKWIDVNDPSTQRVLTRVPETSHADMVKIVDKAEEAFHEWKDSSVLKRQAVMMNLAALIRENHEEIARSIVLEQGKTFADAKGDVLRGLQVVDSMIGVPQMLMGEKMEVSKDMDTETRKVPLGVGAAICPLLINHIPPPRSFNFPAMIPLWSIPMAIATGNSLILKPSERDPGAAMIVAELAERAGPGYSPSIPIPIFHQAHTFTSSPSIGLPNGVLSILHGSIPAVKFICEEPRIKAISFVGSDRAGKYIYDTGSAHGKRVQANLGAKNHCILMPDANRNFALNSVVGAAFGAAGQRCMALSVLVTVGETEDWLPELIERAQQLKVGNGFDPEVDVGPLINPAAKQRVEGLIESCEKQGGKIALDGRGVKVPGYPKGNFVGPTILLADTSMDCYQEEIFGPVLTIVKAKDLDDAIQLINRNRYGNGTAIFTQSGATARKFEKNVEAGQIGINTPIPVPLPMWSWSGNKGSVLGGQSLYGPRGVDFWTQLKTTTTMWRAEDALDSRATATMPTMS